MSAMVRRALALVMVVVTLLSVAGAVGAQPPAESDAPDSDADATPARLSYTSGSVSFWRPGGADWAPAQTNTPLAAGDELFTAHDGNLEVQLGGSAFVRAWGDTQLGVANQDPDFVQLKVTAGHVALDFRQLDAGDVVEVATPGAAFTIDQPGYYRVDVSADRTSFITRRGGRVTMTTAGSAPTTLTAGEAIVIEGPTGSVQRAAAPEGDVWDRWNDARTAALVTTVSARYVAPQVYGTSELDRYGTWRTDATYGPIWVPTAVAPGWAPYSTGRWIWDPRFGWTWVDVAPWGWAPYHYGRWVHVGNSWAWAPGPVVVRPVYAPALVAFFGAPGVGVTVAGPAVGWVALGWGEPCVPWWGRPGFVGRPWWGGWGGPRVRHVTVHRNVTVVNAVVVVRSDQFGRRAVHEARIARPDLKKLEPVRGPLAVKPDAVSFTPGAGRAVRPPDSHLSRPVVSTRPPVQRPDPPRGNDRRDDRDDRAGKPDARPGARGEDKATGKPDARPGGRDDAKPETGGAAKVAPAPGAPSDARPDAKGDARPDGRREGAREARPDAPPERRPDVKPDPRPERKAPPAVKAVPPPAPVPPPAAPQRPAPVAPPVAPPRAPEVPRGAEPPSEMRRPEPPRGVVPPRPEPQRPEPPRGGPQRPEPQRQEPPSGEQRRFEPPRSEAPRLEPRRREATIGEPRRLEVPRAETPRVEAPRRAAAPAPDPGHRPAPARVVTPPRPSGTAPGQGPARPGAPARSERRQER
jgi:hypothetical protein